MPERTTLFFLHGLGCSARLWRHVVAGAAGIGDRFDCVPLDLPGHGSDAGSDELTVEQMADRVVAQIRERQATRWGLVGHSMGGKVATIVAAQAERGHVAGLTAPVGLALVSASPLTPEPMDEGTRAEMIAWCRPGSVGEADAQSFVDANTAARLPDSLRDAAVADVRAVSRDAWLAWLERGSLEDWAQDAGPVRTRTLVVAGADDGPLGEDGQRELVLPRVNARDVVVVAGAAHLMPIEQPRALGELLTTHFAVRAELPTHFAELLNSDRVSAKTRSILLDRLEVPAASGELTDAHRTTLGALLARVVPQRGTDIDLVARLDAQLADPTGDGWRFADLPPDAEAWRRGLETLDALSGGFAGLDGAGRDEWIERMIAGTAASDEAGTAASDEAEHLTASQLTLWFEDVRAEAVRAWLSHPAAQAAIGYDGFANGGDGQRKQGYLRIGMDERDPWQVDLPVGRGTA